MHFQRAYPLEPAGQGTIEVSPLRVQFQVSPRDVSGAQRDDNSTPAGGVERLAFRYASSLLEGVAETGKH